MQTDELATRLPTMPLVTSPEYRLLAILSSGRSIDQRDWLNMRAGWRLADTVRRARRLGWDVRTRLISIDSTNRIGRYSLEESYRSKFSYAKPLAFEEPATPNVEGVMP